MTPFDWKKRYARLATVAFVPAMLVRPAHWPLPAFDPNYTPADFLNNLIWYALVFSVAIVFDALIEHMTQPRCASADGAQPRSVFWSTFTATVLAKAGVEILFRGRPLPAGTDSALATAHVIEAIFLLGLPICYLLGKRMGPVEKWPLVRLLILQRPASKETT